MMLQGTLRQVVMVAVGAAVFAVGATAGAAVVEWEDFEEGLGNRWDRGFSSWVTPERCFLQVDTNAPLSGRKSAVMTDANPEIGSAGIRVDSYMEGNSGLAGTNLWMSVKIRVNETPNVGLYFGLDLNGDYGADAVLYWYPTVSSRWRSAGFVDVPSSDPMAYPQANTTYDVLFSIRTNTYDATVNGVLVLTNAPLPVANTLGTFFFTVNWGGLEGYENTTLQVAIDDIGIYNSDPRIGTETPGSPFLLVDNLHTNASICDGIKEDTNVVWVSHQGSATAYTPGGGVVRGVQMLYGSSHRQACNAQDIDVSSGGSQLIGYFADFPGGQSVHFISSDWPNGSEIFSFGYLSAKRIATGRRMEGGTMQSVYFLPGYMGSQDVRRYTCDTSIGFGGFSFASTPSIGSLVDLSYDQALDTLYWATPDGHLYAGIVSNDTSLAILTDAKIDGGTRIDAGLWNGKRGVLVSFNDGSWQIVGFAGGTIASGTFGSGTPPLGLALAEDRIYYLLPDGQGRSRLYTQSLYKPKGTCILVM